MKSRQGANPQALRSIYSKETTGGEPMPSISIRPESFMQTAPRKLPKDGLVCVTTAKDWTRAKSTSQRIPHRMASEYSQRVGSRNRYACAGGRKVPPPAAGLIHARRRRRQRPPRLPKRSAKPEGSGIAAIEKSSAITPPPVTPAVPQRTPADVALIGAVIL